MNHIYRAISGPVCFLTWLALFFFTHSAAANAAPTDIQLDSIAVFQSGGVNAVVGTLSTTDPDTGDSHSYSLVAGSGDDDNGSFNISGDELRVNDAGSLAAGSYSVRIQTQDGDGETFEEAFIITAVDDIAPGGHSVSFDNGTLNSMEAASASFTFADAEVGADYSYTISSDGGGTPINGSGTIASAGEQIGGIDVSSLPDGTLTLSVTLTDSAGNSAAPVTDTAILDIQAPAVDDVTLPASATYTAGEDLDFAVNYDEAVIVDTSGGTPRLALTIGATTRFATYTGGSGNDTLQFRYTVQNGDNDSDGIALSPTLDDNGGSIRDAAGNDADTSLGTIGSLAGVLVDSNHPPADISLFSSSVNQSGGVDATVGTLGTIDPDTGDSHSYSLVAGAGDDDNGSFNISGDELRANNAGSLAAGSYNVRIQTQDGGGETFEEAFIITVVDDIAPGGHSVSFDDGTTNSAEATSISFTFANAEVGADYSYSISSDGGGTPINGSGTIASAGEQIGGIDVSGLPDGILTLSVTLTDSAGNSAVPVTDTAALDTQAPAVASVTLPANATYTAGEDLDFAVNYDEAVIVDTSGGTPRLALTIGATTRYATYTSGSGSGALHFLYSVQPGDNDSDGIALSPTLDNNGGSIRDAAGNDADTNLGTIGSLAGVLVDGNQPPTGIALSSSSVNQSGGADATVGTLSTTDPDTGDSHSYSLVPGTGDDDNGSFNISGDELRANDAGSLAAGSYNVLIQTQDGGGETFEEAFIITVVDDIAPSGHSVSFDDNLLNSEESASVSFTFADAEVGADYSFSISSSGGGTPVTGAGTVSGAGEQISGIDVSGLSNGTLTLSVILTDSAGNSAAAVTDTATLETTTEFSVASATGTGLIEGSIAGGGELCTISQVLPTSPGDVAGAGPDGVEFEHGLLAISLVNCTPGADVTVTATFPSALSGDTEYYKYGPTPDNPDQPDWYVMPATQSGATFTWTITDGGLGDDDLEENGTILDPGGPASVVAATPGASPVGVPTLPQWGLTLMALLLAGIGIRDMAVKRP